MHSIVRTADLSLLAAMALFNSSCAAPEWSPDPAVEHAVYEQVVRDLVREESITELYVTRIVLPRVPFDVDPMGSPYLGNLLPETVSDFRARIPIPGAISSSLSASIPIHAVSANEMPTICSMPGPPSRCAGRLPGSVWGSVELSAVGFNSTSTQALVYATFGADGGCAAGYYYSLRRHDGKWEVTKRLRNMVS